MNKLLALGLMALSMNTAFAANGTHTGTIDMTRSEGRTCRIRLSS